LWPINEHPAYITNHIKFDRKVEPINRKEPLKAYIESDINKHLGTKVDIYV